MSELPKILLVPVDGSKGANAAAAYAGRLGEQLGVPVRLLFAFPKTPIDMFGGIAEIPNSPDLRYFAPDAFEKLRDESASAAFKAAKEAMKGSSADVSEDLLGGEPGTAIIEHAESTPGAMIVMGRRGLTHFRELVLGSVTQRVMHHADCPVLVVR